MVNRSWTPPSVEKRTSRTGPVGLMMFRPIKTLTCPGGPTLT
jgi:hypothetical protein